MRICHLSKTLTSNDPSKTPKGSSQYHQIFMVLSSQALTPLLKTAPSLQSRRIAPETYLLPFQVTTKLFNTTSTKRFRKKA